MSRHPIVQDPPRNYGAGTVSGRDLYHLVKYEPFNMTALCGVRVMYLVESFHGTSHPVCRKCVKKYEAETGRGVNDPEPNQDATDP